ncbi:sodium-translocating pyrophosphatase [candidate division WOR-3 bacterium RBG_13_43_14]|uniref:Putative K(+)-stimulated pyrophosphate-energized sodium pump n=1 Tax=candidate division WOR-3 bacterium RBG_13_43_14 TaxID=1802590 RepID=A0A1F4UG87_UNCW3|nr:MAG: sodium-translocating pyrophosphatase [candidate division WOR-3 bacterium RBG_13_43_14]
MHPLFWLTPVGSVIALLFAWFLSRTIYKYDEGTDLMRTIAQAVRDGARAYIRRQYLVVGIFFGIVFLLLLVISLLKMLPIFVPFAFITGGFFSGLSGYIGMTQATNAGARTANAARKSLNSALRVAFAAGGVMGFVVVGLSLLDLSIWFIILNWIYRNLPEAVKIQNITSTMICFGMGASAQALFARVGGGIFTKAADVGADLVGKVEAGIPEDDPRNPAVIADNVGDNVGDVAGMGADLYESYVGSIVATMALAVAAGLGIQGGVVPLVMATVGVLASIIGTFLVRTREDASQASLLAALRRGVWGAAILVAITSGIVIKFILPGYFGIYWAIIAGLAAGVFIGYSTEYFTSDHYSPTKGIANAARTGPATVILEGLSVGMISTAPPVFAVVIAVVAAYYLAGGAAHPNLGLFGVAISAVGMLSTLGITLATDAYGPVADNAGGNAEMSKLPPEVRKRTDALDSLGNTTAATGKGFAIGSAALTALALIAAYRDQIQLFGYKLDLRIINPTVMIGLFLGAMMPYAFCSQTIRAVGRAAGKIVLEVRRQFKEIKGLMSGEAKPDYAKVVTICTASAQKEMIIPSLMAIVAPILVGILLGPSAVVGLLAGALISGFSVALKMANAGGAWDNAKKYIERGELGGKGSPAHKAAVVGDTVGDPFKDTAGPSLNILIKLMSTSSITLAGFVLKMALFK